MPEYEVIILPLAEKDIINNTDYIFYEKQAPETALELLTGFRSAIAGLSYMPERYEIDRDDELAILKIRKNCYKNYNIYFYVDTDIRRVFILRVLHMLVDAKMLLLNMNF